MNSKKFAAQVRHQLANGDTVLLEAWFGAQAIGTSFLSMYFDNNLPEVTKGFMWAGVIMGVPQILLAFTDKYTHRNWSNWLTFLLSACISVSLIGVDTDQVAIFGYGFLSLATLNASFIVNRKMHHERSKEQRNERFVDFKND